MGRERWRKMILIVYHALSAVGIYRLYRGIKIQTERISKEYL
jgi:uncharacterized membrane protein